MPYHYVTCLVWNIYAPNEVTGVGATGARLTPDQKVGSSNLSALIGQIGADFFANARISSSICVWPCGQMDTALDSVAILANVRCDRPLGGHDGGTNICRFESCQGRF